MFSKPISCHGRIKSNEFQSDDDISLIISDHLNQCFWKGSIFNLQDGLTKFALDEKRTDVSTLSDRFLLF